MFEHVNSLVKRNVESSSDNLRCFLISTRVQQLCKSPSKRVSPFRFTFLVLGHDRETSWRPPSRDIYDKRLHRRLVLLFDGLLVTQGPDGQS